MAGAAPPPRPFIFVLAGVNGAGKSSVGGALLAAHGLSWFNPDSYARALVAQLGLEAEEANGRAWQYGREQLEQAIAQRTSFAFETTLGAHTIPNLLAQAAATHDVVMIFCGLASPELHLARVRFRVAHGGHDIPEAKIRERWTASRANLVRLLPVLARLQVFDNSAPAAPDGDIPDPVLVLEMQAGRTLYPLPGDAQALAATPEWARPVVQAALDQSA
jgi:predicted ABC-type ATPase